jgi:16S rRNA processing protein RimM
MDKKDFYFLGKITKTSGYQGNLVFFFDVDDISHYSDLKAVFVEINNDLIPFAIKELQLKSNHSAFVTMEDVTSEDQAKQLVGYDLYLPMSFLPPLTGKKFYFHEITGFTVIDEVSGNIGIIVNIIDHSGNALFVIMNNGKEILIPINDEIIKKVDRTKKTIEVKAPEGLIEIYI